MAYEIRVIKKEGFSNVPVGGVVKIFTFNGKLHISIDSEMVEITPEERVKYTNPFIYTYPELVEQCKKSEYTKTCRGVQDIDALTDYFDLGAFDITTWAALDDHFTSVYAHQWVCTDTVVGYGCLYLDSEMVGIFHQSARKSDCSYAFLNMEMVEKVRDFLLSITDREKYNNIQIIKETDDISWIFR